MFRRRDRHERNRQEPGIAARRCLQGVHRGREPPGPGGGGTVRGRRPLPRELRRVHPRVRGLGGGQKISPPGLEGPSRSRVELDQVLASGDVALAHGTVRGTATGRLYGAPATKRSFQASFFDYVRVDDGQIIERVQQADMLAQMRQLYGKALGLIGLDAMFLRL